MTLRPNQAFPLRRSTRPIGKWNPVLEESDQLPAARRHHPGMAAGMGVTAKKRTVVRGVSDKIVREGESACPRRSGAHACPNRGSGHPTGSSLAGVEG